MKAAFDREYLTYLHEQIQMITSMVAKLNLRLLKTTKTDELYRIKNRIIEESEHLESVEAEYTSYAIAVWKEDKVDEQFAGFLHG